MVEAEELKHENRVEAILQLKSKIDHVSAFAADPLVNTLFSPNLLHLYFISVLCPPEYVASEGEKWEEAQQKANANR